MSPFFFVQEFDIFYPAEKIIRGFVVLNLLHQVRVSWDGGELLTEVMIGGSTNPGPGPRTDCV